MKTVQAPFLFTLIAFLVFSCGQEELVDNIEVYFNDFDNGNLPSIQGGFIMEYNGSNVIGNYNNSGFQLSLTGLPDHDFIVVSFDLNIHDTWDGNANGFEPDFPDTWVMEFNKGIALDRTSNPKFETTFSNGPCDSQLCLWQSYPEIFPFVSGPQTGVDALGPGLCLLASSQTGTSIYRIQKTFRHEDATLLIDFYDKLYQPNVQSALCDESWSMDNLMVRALKTN